MKYSFLFVGMLVVNKVIFFLVIILTSCSSIQFNSSEIISVSFDKDSSVKETLDVDVEKSFYLWGLIPSQHTVEVDKVFEEKGALSVSQFSIKEIKTKKKSLWMILTAGLYYPETYKISGIVSR